MLSAHNLPKRSEGTKVMAKYSEDPDRKVDIKDNHLGIKLIPMISTWDQVDPIFPVRTFNAGIIYFQGFWTPYGAIIPLFYSQTNSLCP
jgi:hypothetical protein